jgi:hypothetical protein
MALDALHHRLIDVLRDRRTTVRNRRAGGGLPRVPVPRLRTRILMNERRSPVGHGQARSRPDFDVQRSRVDQRRYVSLLPAVTLPARSYVRNWTVNVLPYFFGLSVNAYPAR